MTATIRGCRRYTSAMPGAWLKLSSGRGAPLWAKTARGEIPAWQPAYLEERIRYFEGRPQLYETQYDPDENVEPAPAPLEDPEQSAGAV